MTLLLLLGLSAAVAAVVPAVLARATWAVRAPRLGVLAWEAAAATLVLSAFGAALAMTMPWHEANDAVCMVWRLCLDALSGAHGRAAQLMSWIGLTVLVAALARMTWAGARLVRVVGLRRHHGRQIRLAGKHRPDMDATVIEHPDPAVYLVPGRGEQIVVTTGALSRLDQDGLAAVLAHERAHARGRHHLILTFSGLLHDAFPRVTVFAQADRQVRRLVEICADDDACRHHSRLALARALVALATPAAAPGALAADGGDALQRMRRLMDPPPPLPRYTQLAAAAALMALPVLPLAILLSAPVVPVLAAGPPLW
jgi:Zn-dependent protease with chaperone function